MPGGRSLLLAGVIVALAAITGARGCTRCGRGRRETVSTRAEKPQPPALTADEERFADSLVGRPPRGDPVGGGDELCRHHLIRRGSGRARARTRRSSAGEIPFMMPKCRSAHGQPRVVSRTQGKYVDAMALSPTLPRDTEIHWDGDSQRLGDAHDDVRASEDMLRVGEVLWPGQYKPHWRQSDRRRRDKRSPI